MHLWKHSARHKSGANESLPLAIGVFMGIGLAAFGYPYYEKISLWIGPVIFLMVLNIAQIPSVSRRTLCMPQFAILVCGFQLVLMAWASFYFPHPDALYVLGDRLPAYLEYTAPLFVAIFLAWNITGINLPGKTLNDEGYRKVFSPGLDRELHWLYWGGLLIFLAGGWRYVPGGVGFVVRLVADLRFVAVIGFMLADRKGWRWRLALVVGSLMVQSTQNAMFHDVILWGLCLLAVYWYRFPKRRLGSMLIILLALLALPVVEHAKNRMRYALWFGHMHVDSMYGDGMDVTPYNHAYIYGLYLAEGTTLYLQGDLPLTLITSRHNQGWIINRIMQHVPAEEPFARGETLITAGKAALLPRVFATDKYRAGGVAYMQRFANFELNTATSMNIGWAGEMYANFGKTGGIIASALMATLLGLGIRCIAYMARRHPLWWAMLPYAGQQAIKTEEGFGEIINWIVKGSLIFIVLFYSGVLPHARRAMFGRRSSSRPKRTVPRESRTVPTHAA